MVSSWETMAAKMGYPGRRMYCDTKHLHQLVKRKALDKLGLM